MKQFFKFMFASMIGTLITVVLASFITMAIFFGMLSSVLDSSSEMSDGKKVKLDSNTVLQVKLNYPIQDRNSDNPFENFDFGTMKSSKGLGLNKLLKSIKAAKDDDKIKGIYLDLASVPSGMATLEEVRNALVDFKTSGKWIISYSEVYTQGSYYLASVSDQIYLNPAGMVEHRGLASELMFFKKALEKLDVEMQIIRHGKFKSAVEPYMLEKMSDANREQYQLILNTAWNSLMKQVSESRDIPMDKLNELADNLTIQDAVIAKQEGLVDELYYKDQLLAELRKRLNTEEDEDIASVSLKDYSKSLKKSKKKKKEDKKSKNKIAVVYAAGNIVSGESNNESMGSETI